ncbi:C/D box methylation guide ribonucleoprotein complex aNOP56 subunit [Candidatus Woesearchaeota archaeon]|nr:C/D box methylation guide ribonucleoprotein complex aNOP56 subunit [Candidatus Woesearchaeota archaeon]
MHLFSNMLGVFVFDEKFDLVDKILFNSLEDYKDREKFIEKIRNKHKSLKNPENESLKKILLYFRNNKFFNDFYNRNLELTKHGVKNAVNADTMLIQAINSIGEIEKSINILVKRLREWYGMYNPEFSMSAGNHETFVNEILEKEKSELLQELKINPADSIGAGLGQEDLEPIRGLAQQIYGLYQLRKGQFEYASSLMDGLCPNIKEICGVLTGAKLLEHAGSLKRLSEMPASTIQILGAEKALFRHMKTGAKSPRHGLIAQHPLIARAPDRMRGRIARALADKISIASKVDYFKGKFVGDKLRKELEDKLKIQNGYKKIQDI